jgi:Flp pilus assembly protein TadD
MRIDDATTQTEVLGVGGSATDHLRHGRALLQTGRTNEAISQLSKSLSLDPQLSEAANLLGVAFDRKGMRERAKEYYEKALKISPDDAQILNNLGYSLYLNGNYRSAVDKLKKANRLNPNDKRVLNNLALAQCRIGKYDDAYKNFAKAGGEFTGRLNIASILERQGRDEQAIAHYEAARRLQPTSATVLGQLTALYKRTGMKDPADSVKTEAVEETEESLASVEE